MPGRELNEDPKNDEAHGVYDDGDDEEENRDNASTDNKLRTQQTHTRHTDNNKKGLTDSSSDH